MNKLALLAPMLTLSALVSASPAGTSPHWKGTIAVTGQHTPAELAGKALVSEADARKTALGALPAKDADKKVTEAELEVEHGYLVWSIDVKVSGKPGSEEVLVDAGTGKVLATKHESEEEEAAEAREDAKNGSKK